MTNEFQQAAALINNSGPWIVEVVNLRGEVVKSVPCNSERAAERAERGVLINLNHAAFFTRIENKAKEPQA